MPKDNKNPFDDLSISELEELFSLEVNSSSNFKQKINISDIGFGFSQVFPIIMESLRIPPEHTMILEQPELHLHPKLQMQLADYFISMALSGKRFIIETHSEHILYSSRVHNLIDVDSKPFKSIPLGGFPCVVHIGVVHMDRKHLIKRCL